MRPRRTAAPCQSLPDGCPSERQLRRDQFSRSDRVARRERRRALLRWAPWSVRVGVTAIGGGGVGAASPRRLASSPRCQRGEEHPDVRVARAVAVDRVDREPGDVPDGPTAFDDQAPCRTLSHDDPEAVPGEPGGGDGGIPGSGRRERLGLVAAPPVDAFQHRLDDLGRSSAPSGPGSSSTVIARASHAREPGRQSGAPLGSRAEAVSRDVQQIARPRMRCHRESVGVEASLRADGRDEGALAAGLDDGHVPAGVARRSAACAIPMPARSSSARTNAPSGPGAVRARVDRRQPLALSGDRACWRCRRSRLPDAVRGHDPRRRRRQARDVRASRSTTTLPTLTSRRHQRDRRASSPSTTGARSRSLTRVDGRDRLGGECCRRRRSLRRSRRPWPRSCRCRRRPQPRRAPRPSPCPSARASSPNAAGTDSWVCEAGADEIQEGRERFVAGGIARQADRPLDAGGDVGARRSSVPRAAPWRAAPTARARASSKSGTVESGAHRRGDGRSAGDRNARCRA